MNQGSAAQTAFESPSEIDARLVSAAHDLILAGREQLPVGATLERTLPKIAKQIKKDSETPDLFELWGQSINFDENAEQTIVDPAVLLALREISGVPLGSQIVHAGLEHTYGYLLSLVETPYGSKRARWVEPTIEQGFGIEDPLLRPYPTKGTLLLNVTSFLGRIAFRQTRREGVMLDDLPGVPTKLRRYPFSALKIQRITETCIGPNERGALREVNLITDLVQFPHPTPDAIGLLIYSVYSSDTDRNSLITAFPIGQPALEELTDPPLFGVNQEIRTRYNCFLPGITGQIHNGIRTLTAG